MRPSTPVLPAASFLLLVALAAPTFAGNPPGRATGTAAPIPDEAPVAAPATPVARRVVNPLYPRIAAMLEAEKQQLVALRTKLAVAKDSDAAMAIQREIEQVKVGTEIGILRLQAEHARQRGRTATADGLEAAIRQMQQPPARATSATRPAPATESASTPSR